MSDPVIFSSPVLQFAGDATYNTEGDARDGTSVKVQPALGVIRQGRRPARQPAAQYENWILSQLAGVSAEIINGLRTHGLMPVYQEILTVGGAVNVVIPANAAPIALLDGCGGGGGGGGGAANPGTDYFASGGGGGGGAVRRQQRVTVVPGHTYLASVGDGGPGGAGGTSSNNGSNGINGFDTSFVHDGDFVEVARFAGGAGGLGGQKTTSLGATIVTWGLGGSPVKLSGSYVPAGQVDGATFVDYYRHGTPQHGGNGYTSNNSVARYLDGLDSPEGFVGGNQGAPSTASSTGAPVPGGDSFVYRGGGGGGGGGAGPFGNGAVGGDGGAANYASYPDGGTAGAWGSANSGAGGGGGGSCGGGSSVASSQTGGSGGKGGSGRLRIVLFVPIYDGS